MNKETWPTFQNSLLAPNLRVSPSIDIDIKILWIIRLSEHYFPRQKGGGWFVLGFIGFVLHFHEKYTNKSQFLATAQIDVTKKNT